MVTVITVGVEEGVAEAGIVIVLITVLASGPSPTVIVTTDTTGVAVGAAPVTVTALVRIVSEIVIVMTETIGVLGSTASTVIATPVSTGGEELREASTDEEIADASVTGHTVVVTPITVVTKTVDTPSGREVGREVTTPVPEIAGQLVTVDAHEIMVSIEVADIVRVVRSATARVVDVFANGGMVELANMLPATVTLFIGLLVTAADKAAIKTVNILQNRLLVCCRSYHLLQRPWEKKS